MKPALTREATRRDWKVHPPVELGSLLESPDGEAWHLVPHWVFEYVDELVAKQSELAYAILRLEAFVSEQSVLIARYRSRLDTLERQD